VIQEGFAPASNGAVTINYGLNRARVAELLLRFVEEK
jgi:hypothetical protein